MRFRGGAALEFPGDESVWAKLDGDARRAARHRARGAAGRSSGWASSSTAASSGHGSRWAPSPTTTTAPYLQSVVAALEALEGRPWTVDAVSLMRRPLEREVEARFSEVERMPLAQSDAAPLLLGPATGPDDLTRLPPLSAADLGRFSAITWSSWSRGIGRCIR